MRALDLGSPGLASPFERRVLPSPTFGVGRVCRGFEKPGGCGTILCRYNRGPLCYVCTRAQRDRERMYAALVVAA